MAVGLVKIVIVGAFVEEELVRIVLAVVEAESCAQYVDRVLPVLKLSPEDIEELMGLDIHGLQSHALGALVVLDCIQVAQKFLINLMNFLVEHLPSSLRVLLVVQVQVKDGVTGFRLHLNVGLPPLEVTAHKGH
jgi:hypothetical protein